MTFALIATILWYFPGFGTGELPAADKERLKASFSADQVVCKQWCPSCATWEESVAKVNNASQSVVTEIQSLKPDERTDIVLVGHSLGGRVVAYSLAKLGELGISIRTAVLLAHAISSGDQYASNLYHGCSSIILVVGENDYVLKWFYRVIYNNFPKKSNDIQPKNKNNKKRIQNHNHNLEIKKVKVVDCYKIINKGSGNKADLNE